MKIRYFLIISLLLSFAVACKCHKSTTNAAEVPVAKPVTTADDSTMRFIVGFFSIGSGTEGEQINKLKNFIYEYGSGKSKEILFNTVYYGREGEIDFCFPLKELNADEQKDFITKAKSTLKEGKWIQYFENQVCRKQN